jgi:flagellar biosynthetic protein FliQ
MQPELVSEVAAGALRLTLVLSGILLLPALAVGLAVSIFQAATQLNEMTLSFIPKLLVTVLVLVLAGPAMLAMLSDYTLELFHNIPALLG